RQDVWNVLHVRRGRHLRIGVRDSQVRPPEHFNSVRPRWKVDDMGKRSIPLGGRALVAIVAVLAAIICLLPAATTGAAATAACPSGATMNIVAHQDDDLLFLSPDLLHDVQSARCVRTVFVTAGDADNG